MVAIGEEKRIEFTKRLLDLRDDVVDELAFPSDLTNEERKFLHKIAQDYGLKSKSVGKGENRYITVRKHGAKSRTQLGQETPSIPVSWTPDVHTLRALLDPTFSADLNHNSVPMASIVANSVKPPQTVQRPHRPNVARFAQAHAQAQAKRLANTSYRSIQQKRHKLPAHEHVSCVVDAIKNNQIVLICGETGCGKSTQVPQFLLDDEQLGPTCRIAISQPRRISAVSVAERIASERSERIGDTVGYNIRLESEKSDHTQVLFMTPGVLLRKLQSDPLLAEYTHVIVDEAHERDRFTEFLLIILRDVCAKRADLRLILMSATMHTDKLRAYFGDIPTVTVGGSVFPVQEYYLEHALQFTGHLDGSGYGGGGGGGVGTGFGGTQFGGRSHPSSTMSHGSQPTSATNMKASHQHSVVHTAHRQQMAPLKAPEYFCCICDGGPFPSSVELGEHTAMCFPSNSQPRTAANRPPSAHTGGGTLMERIQAMRMLSSGNGGGNAKSTPVTAAVIPAPVSIASMDTSTVEQLATDDQQQDDDYDAEGGDENDDSRAASVGFDVTGGDQAVAELEGLGAATVDHQVDDDPNARAVEALLAAYQRQWDDSQVDYQLIVNLLQYVFLQSEHGRDGSVLVFLPGWDDISRLHGILSSHSAFSNQSVYKLIQLHSSIPKKEQDRVFHALGRGEHKIILSTNIAETSITIDDVTVVINAGRVKEKTYDPHTKLGYLQSSWISQASARQRKGRAGRTQSGVCFHLYSRLRSQHLSDHQDSELLRMPLEELVLQAKTLGVAPGSGDEPDSVKSFLLKAMDPPHLLSISNAVQLLKAIACITEDEQLTLVGDAISKLPMNPRMGRMILLGCLCGVGPAVVTTAAAMGYRDPFVMPATDQQRMILNKIKARLSGGNPSDQVAVLRAIEGFQQITGRSASGFTHAAYRYCDDNFLSHSTMLYMGELVKQLKASLGEAGIHSHQPYAHRANGNINLTMALIGTGLYPDVGVRRLGTTVFTTEKGCKAKIHPGSINVKSVLLSKNPARHAVECMGFTDLIATLSSATNSSAIRSANLAMLGTTPLSVFAVLLTCGVVREVGRETEGDSDDEDEAVITLVKRGSGSGGRGGRSPVKEAKVTSPLPAAQTKTKHEECREFVTVEVDGWLQLKLRADHLSAVTAARNVLSAAIVEYVRDPHRPLPPQLARGVDRIADALSAEQARLVVGV